MRMRQNEEFHLEAVNRYLIEQGCPNALVITIKQAMELLQVKSKETIYRHFNVINGRISKVEMVKYLCSLGTCKNIGA